MKKPNLVVPRTIMAIIILVTMTAIIWMMTASISLDRGRADRDHRSGFGRKERRGRRQEWRRRRELIGWAFVLGDVGVRVPIVKVAGASVHQRPPRFGQSRVIRSVPRPARCASAGHRVRIKSKPPHRCNQLAVPRED